MSAWTEERVAKLTELWCRGLPASEIAVQLGGVTRCAVIGKAHRTGLPGRPSPINANPNGDTYQRRAKKRAAAEKYLNTPITLPEVKMEPEPEFQEPEIDKYGSLGCQWIEGEVPRYPAEPAYCNAKREHGKPYCAGHNAVAFRKPRGANDVGG